MINLIFMELKKQFSKKGIIILFILICVASFLIVYFSNKNSNYEIDNIYESVLIIDKLKYKEDYNTYLKVTKKYNNTVDKNIKIYNYMKEHNINDYQKEKSILNNGLVFISFMSIIICIISSSIISEELNKKSIKELLTKPHKRNKILLSKIVCIFVLMLTITALMYILFTSLTCVFTKTNIFNIKSILLNNNGFYSVSYALLYLKEMFICSIPLYFISIFCIFLSVILPNSKIVSSIGIFLSLMSTMIFQLLLTLDINIVKYTFLPYIDLNIYNKIYDIYLLNIEYGVNLNRTTGIILLVIFSIIFYILTSIIFKRKDMI